MRLTNIANPTKPEPVANYWGGTDVTNGKVNLLLLGGENAMQLTIELAEVDSVIKALNDAKAALLSRTKASERLNLSGQDES